MSANIGIVRLNGRMYRVDKSAFETDDRLYMRTWFCAKRGSVDLKTMSNSQRWVNEKYFNMKYIDTDGN